MILTQLYRWRFIEVYMCYVTFLIPVVLLKSFICKIKIQQFNTWICIMFLSAVTYDNLRIENYSQVLVTGPGMMWWRPPTFKDGLNFAALLRQRLHLNVIISIKTISRTKICIIIKIRLFKNYERVREREIYFFVIHGSIIECTIDFDLCFIYIV